MRAVKRLIAHGFRLITEAIRFRRICVSLPTYHSAATMHMRLHWIFDDMPILPETLLENFICMWPFPLNDLIFENKDDRSPFLIAARTADKLREQRVAEEKA